MTEPITIKAKEYSNVFVEPWDEGAWISIHTRGGSAHCVVPFDQIPAMIAALQAALEKQS